MRAGGSDWWVEVAGAASAGARYGFVHGSASSGHSWDGLREHLDGGAHHLVVDLPGHGRSGPAAQSEPALHAYAEGLAELLDGGRAQDRVVVAHSAGVAITLLALQRGLRCRAIVGINPSLGAPGLGQSETVHALVSPLVGRTSARGFAWMARHTGIVGTLLASTGSTVPDASARRYRELMGSADHVNGILALFRAFQPHALRAVHADPGVPLLWIIGAQDQWIEPALSRRWASRVPGSTVVTLPGGHLVHEERPQKVSEAIRAFLESQAESTP